MMNKGKMMHNTSHNHGDMHAEHKMADMLTTMVHGLNMSGMHHGHDMSNMSMGHNMSHMNHGGGSGHDMSHMNYSGGSVHDMSHMNHSGGSGHDMSQMYHGDGSGHDMSNMNHGDGSGHDMHMMGGMKMYFHPGVSEYILFEDCHTSTAGGLIGACFAIFAVAVLYEGLKFLREVLLQRSLRDEPRLMYGDNEVNKDGSTNGSRLSNVGSRMFSSGHFLQTLLHVIQVFVSYCLMLVFMTYNVWLCLAVVLGAGVGYFLFGWKRAVVVDSNEHCH